MKRKYVYISLGCMATVLALFYVYYYQLHVSFSLRALQQEDHFMHTLLRENYYTAVLVYILLFALIVGLGIPGSPPMMLFAGYLFGVEWGTLYAMIGALLGSVTSFLLLRYAFSSYVLSLQSPHIRRLRKQLDTYGASYLLMMHFATIIPYFVINGLAAISAITLAQFIGITCVGSLPMILIYAFAGKQLATIGSVNDIFSAPVLIALLLLLMLALIPMIVRSYKNRYEKEF